MTADQLGRYRSFPPWIRVDHQRLDSHTRWRGILLSELRYRPRERRSLRRPRADQELYWERSSHHLRPCPLMCKFFILHLPSMNYAGRLVRERESLRN